MGHIIRPAYAKETVRFDQATKGQLARAVNRQTALIEDLRHQLNITVEPGNWINQPFKKYEPQLAGLLFIACGLRLIWVGTRRIDLERKGGWALAVGGAVCGAIGLAAIGAWL